MKHLPLSALTNTTPIPVRYLVESSGDPVVLSSMQQVVSDIVSGQIEGVTAVLEIYEDDGVVDNITEDVARKVLAESGADRSYGARSFIHEFVGLEACA